ncbi:Domain of unknown function DUF4007 [Oxalobacteraceae bacterium]
MFDTTLGSKPQFSGHETFPLRQLWLKKAYDAVADAPYFGEAPKSIFSDEDAIVSFGVGKNMVSSIRFWAIACNILEEHGDSYRTTQTANLLFDEFKGLDPYSESSATVWLMHWVLASTPEKTTSWYYLFNHIVQQFFHRESVIDGITAELEGTKVKLSKATLKRDVECCFRSYVPRIGSDSPEELSEPLLGELSLLSESSKGTFEFRRGPKKSLPDGVFGYALLDYWLKQAQFGTGAVLSFDRVAHDYGSPGRVFKLDENSVAERLISLESISNGQLQWVEQAGLRQITLKNTTTRAVESLKEQLLKKAYQ